MSIALFSFFCGDDLKGRRKGKQAKKWSKKLMKPICSGKGILRERGIVEIAVDLTLTPYDLRISRNAAEIFCMALSET